MRRLYLRVALVGLIAGALAFAATKTTSNQQTIITQDLGQLPLVTATKHHKAGDPINVGLVGGEGEITATMQAAGWTVPVPVTFKSSVKIAESVAIGRAYLTAPVSTLFYEGRKQDLAFEKEEGKSAKQRHHVRFWKLRDDEPDGRALWMGAATFDKGVGLSHRSLAVTHHINADVDAERDFLMNALNKTGRVARVYTIKGSGQLKAKNGGGDAYFSDGNVAVAVIAAGAK